MTRLLGLLIVVGIVMYLTVTQMNPGSEGYAVPCKDIKRAVRRGKLDKLEKLVVSHTRDRGISMVALTGRAGECAESGELSAGEAEQFMIMVLPQ